MQARITLRFIFTLIVGDILAILGAYSLAYIWRMKIITDPVQTFVSARAFFVSLLLLLPFNLIIFSLIGLYRHQRTVIKLVCRLLVGAFAAMLFMVFVDYFHVDPIFPAKKVVVYGFILSIILLGLERSFLYGMRYLIHRWSSGLPKVLVVGTSAVAHAIVRAIQQPGSGYELAGVVGDRRLRWTTFKTFDEATLAVQPDLIIQANSPIETKINSEYLSYAEAHYADFKFVPTDTSELGRKLEMELFMGDVPVISVRPTQLIGWRRVFKRLFDFIASFCGLIILSPLFLIIYLAEKLSDPHGSALFHQTRLTRGDQQFQLYKFRTQYAKYDGTTPEQAFTMMGKPELIKHYRTNGDFLEYDPRVTKIGHFLRKYSLDELPQLFNVLRGDISLVGPRALIPEELNSYANKHTILNVKSGITGLAQISGRRDLPWEQRRKLDVYYVQHWTYLMDLRILFQTFWQVLTGRGAK